MLELYTFTISTFSEKVRWVLDWEGLPYREHRLLPGPHGFTIRRLAPRTEVPVLVHDGHAVQGSSDILDYLERRLNTRQLCDGTDAAQGRRLERLIDRALGRGVQTLAYDALLHDPPRVIALWAQGKSSRWTTALYSIIYPAMARGVRRLYRATPEGVGAARAKFSDAMNELDRILAEHPFLGGERPSRLDVTCAALLAPLCRPPNHLVPWPELPPALAEFAAEFVGKPTWRHVLRMYEGYRRTPPSAAATPP
jgi:glutathione S-transferase